MNSTTVTGSPSISGDQAVEETAILKQMNDDERRRLIPTIVFLAIISVLGIFGNGIVCHVYRTKYRLSNSQCFILCLSAIDLLTCSIAIPFEIFTVIDQYMFTEQWLCKVARFFNTIGTMSSSFLLLVIAIDRYRKVCKPFGWQISSNAAKILCGISIVFGLVLAVPAVFIYGKQTFEIDGMAMNGTECSTDDEMVETIYPFINAALFGTLFLSGIVTICILYCLIGAEVKRHANTMPGQYTTSRNASVPMVSSVDEGCNSRISVELTKEGKTTKESKRKSKTRTSKVKKSESDLSWNANNEDLSYTMDSTANNNVRDGNCIELVNEAIKKDKNCDSNTDSDDSGIRSDQVIHENNECDQVVNSEIPPIPEDTDTLQSPEESGKPGEVIDPQDSAMEENEAEKDEEGVNLQTDEVIFNENEDTKESTDKSSLGNSPSTSNDQMVTNYKYTKNERSRSRLSSISSRISNAIRRMTSISSVTSSVTMRKTQYLKQARARKTAFLMFMISLAFVLSYFPHLLLLILREIKKDFVDDMTENNKAIYKFFLRSYFLNSAINPIIYGVCDTRFRTACKEIFSCCNTKEKQ